MSQSLCIMDILYKLFTWLVVIYIFSVEDYSLLSLPLLFAIVMELKVVLVGIAMFTFFWAETGSSDCYQSSFANGSFRSSKSFKTWIIQKSLIFS